MNLGESRVAEWWLPSDGESKSVPGVYEVSQHGRAQAILHRPFPGYGALDAFTSSAIEYPLVHGMVSGTYVTLVRCTLRGGRSGFTHDHVEAPLAPWMAIEGLLLPEEELKFSKVHFSFENQATWVGHHSFVAKRLKNSAFPRSVNYEPLKTVSAPVPTGRLSVEDTSSFQPGQAVKLTSSFKFALSLRKSLAVTEVVPTYIHPLGLMLTLATTRECGIEEMLATCKDWVIEGEKHPGQRWVKVRLGRKSDDERKPPHTFQLLFGFADMDWKKQAAEVIKVAQEWKYPIQQWATLANHSFLWPLGRFANAVQAAESIDRILYPEVVFEPDIQQADAINELLKNAGYNSRTRSKVKEALLRPREASLEARLARLGSRVEVAMAALEPMSGWPSKIARLRHVASHGLEPSARLVKDARAPQVATELLLYLLECLFLERIGFAEDKIAAIQKRRSNFGYRQSIIKQNDDAFDAF